jgi:hypothetical protein
MNLLLQSRHRPGPLQISPVQTSFGAIPNTRARRPSVGGVLLRGNAAAPRFSVTLKKMTATSPAMPDANGTEDATTSADPIFKSLRRLRRGRRDPVKRRRRHQKNYR